MPYAIFHCKNKSGQVPPQSSCDFLPPGGTIGRSVDNNLVLPDEERAISRLQAIVHISADGECRITNRGNVTRVLLNDIPLERGRQVELQDGDVLGIDDYQIEVSALQQHAAPQAQPVAKAAAVAAAAALQPPPKKNPPRPSPTKSGTAWWKNLRRMRRPPSRRRRSPIQATTRCWTPRSRAEPGRSAGAAGGRCRSAPAAAAANRSGGAVQHRHHL